MTAAALLLARGAAQFGGRADATGGRWDQAVVASWPAELQQLVAGTQAFTAAPWFTEATAAAGGGDVAPVHQHVLPAGGGVPAAADQRPRARPPGADGRGAVPAAAAGENEVFPNGDAAYDVAHGTCAADLPPGPHRTRRRRGGSAGRPSPTPRRCRQMAANGGRRRPADRLHGRPRLLPVLAGVLRQLRPGRHHRPAAVHRLELQRAAAPQRHGRLDRGRTSRCWTGWASSSAWSAPVCGPAGAWVVSGLGWVLGKVGEFDRLGREEGHGAGRRVLHRGRGVAVGSGHRLDGQLHDPEPGHRRFRHHLQPDLRRDAGDGVPDLAGRVGDRLAAGPAHRVDGRRGQGRDGHPDWSGSSPT